MTFYELHDEPVLSSNRPTDSVRRRAKSGSSPEHVQSEYSRRRPKKPPIGQSPSEVTLITNSTPEPLTFEWIRGELIGKGSYGKVFMALNATTGEIIAVKQVELPQASARSDSRQKEVIDALKFESETLKDLDHPNVVQYLGFEESINFMSIFLEYVPGGSVGSCLNNHGAFSEDVTKSFTSQILNGLEYLHSQGIIHRDLKADNILVEREGRCKISDFGISKKAEEASTGMKGTVFWMAPEVVGPGKSGYSSKVDIWSMGCVILEMWTGVRPWDGQETIPVMLMLFRDKRAPPIPPTLHLSELAEGLRQKCFTVDPQNRPTAAELRKHPYLIPTPGWVFNPADIEGGPGKRKPSMSNLMDHARGLRSGPQGRAPDSYNGAATLRPYQPTPEENGTMPGFSNPDLEGIETYRPPTNHAPPPVVFITPPGSPRITHDRLSVATSSSSSESVRVVTTPHKSFYVVNPDPDEERSRARPSPYVYSPPSLPNTAPPPLPLTAAPPLPPQRLATSQSMSQLGVHSSQRHARSHSQSSSPGSSTTYVDSAGSSSSFKGSPVIHNRLSIRAEDSDSDDESGTWKIRPVDMESLASKATGKSNMPRNSMRKSRRISKRDSAWARPYIEDVYQHIEEYFPDHDLDKPIINIGAGVPENNRAKRKTIRMVAEERLQVDRHTGEEISRMRRRGTKLWNHQVHELKSSEFPVPDMPTLL
ncbi:kinase-like domain-containing protein [Mycena floridula]|nr:kinase-like domain-containing protein [Mycena floridula]